MGFNLYEWSQRAYLRFKTWRFGEQMGTDSLGNVYYRDRKDAGSKRERRWVVYAGASDASLTPPEWHAWLHFTTNEVPGDENPLRRQWQSDHVPNLTGTLRAYRPPGAVEQGARRAPATGDYEPWVPE